MAVELFFRGVWGFKEEFFVLQSEFWQKIQKYMIIKAPGQIEKLGMIKL